MDAHTRGQRVSDGGVGVQLDFLSQRVPCVFGLARLCQRLGPKVRHAAKTGWDGMAATRALRQ
jgi:hypothetical protein